CAGTGAGGVRRSGVYQCQTAAAQRSDSVPLVARPAGGSGHQCADRVVVFLSAGVATGVHPARSGAPEHAGRLVPLPGTGPRRGRDEIGDVAVLFNSLLSSLEYSHNLMAKTNMVSSELLAKMDSSTTHLVEPPVDEQNLKQTLDIAYRLNEALEKGLIELYLQP